jgi:hypothetical protein
MLPAVNANESSSEAGEMPGIQFLFSPLLSNFLWRAKKGKNQITVRQLGRSIAAIGELLCTGGIRR